MTAVRAVLIAVTIFLLAASPLLLPVFGGASAQETIAYAARPIGLDAGSTAQDNNNNDNNNNNNNNGNDNNINDNNDNGNVNDNNDNNNNGNDNNGNDNNGNDNNGNDNNDNNGNGNGNGNGNDNNGNDNGGFQNGAPHVSADSRTGTTKCFSPQEVGLIQRTMGDGDVTVSVPPDAGMIQVTRLTLHSVDPTTTTPASGGTFLDSLVFQIDAQDGCDGAPIVQLSAPVNLGITYRIAADKSKLQIVYLQNGAWTNVTTVPDPAATNTYISATIDKAGTYAIVQKP